MIRSVYYQPIVHSNIDIYRVSSFAALPYSHCICLLEIFVVFKHVSFKTIPPTGRTEGYNTCMFYKMNPPQTYENDNRRQEAAWPSGQRVGLIIPRSQVQAHLWPLAVFVLSRPEFRSLATLVNSQLVTSCQLGFLILLCYV